MSKNLDQSARVIQCIDPYFAREKIVFLLTKIFNLPFIRKMSQNIHLKKNCFLGDLENLAVYKNPLLSGYNLLARPSEVSPLFFILSTLTIEKLKITKP